MFDAINDKIMSIKDNALPEWSFNGVGDLFPG